jgi:hypothetical protein
MVGSILFLTFPRSCEQFMKVCLVHLERMKDSGIIDSILEELKARDEQQLRSSSGSSRNGSGSSSGDPAASPLLPVLSPSSEADSGREREEGGEGALEAGKAGASCLQSFSSYHELAGQPQLKGPIIFARSLFQV